MSDIVLFFPKYETTDVKLLPMSLLSIAAPLVKAGYRVKIIDQRLERNWQTVLLSELKERPLLFGVSALTGRQILNGLEASRLVRKNSNIPIIWGGVHPSLLPEQTLENEYIDFVIIGEGEEAFLELVSKLSFGKPIGVKLQNIKGLGYKKDSRIFLNPPRDFIDLDKTPEIPYHLIDIEEYIAKKSFATGKPAREIALYTSRGCPHRCSFCYNKSFNKRRWRGKSAERVVEDMVRLIRDYRISAFDIEDDEFFANLDRAEKICHLIKKEGLKIEILTTCRVSYIPLMSNDFLKLIYEVGFRTLSFGVETGSDRLIKMIAKDISFDQVFETINRLGRVGINSKFFFMAGFPTETTHDLYQTTDLIYKMKQLDPQIRIPAWRIVTPFPGTELYIESLKYGFIPPKSLEEWADFSFETFKTSWLTQRQKRIIKNVAFLINYLAIKKTRGRGIFFKLAKIFGKIVDWRWKNHFFSFVPEKYIINLLLKIKRLIIKS